METRLEIDLLDGHCSSLKKRYYCHRLERQQWDLERSRIYFRYRNTTELGDELDKGQKKNGRNLE